MIARKIDRSQLEHWLIDYIDGSDNPDLKIYGRPLATDAAIRSRFLWFLRYVLDLGAIRGGRMIDIGCGFGWQAMMLSILGDCELVANDMRESMTGPLQERVAAVQSRGAPTRVEPLMGDFCTLDLPDHSFDAAFSNQTIEHIHDLDAMFEQCYRILRPGGSCIMVNDNNALNAEEREHAAEMWEKRDESQEFIDQLKKQRPIENKDARPYALMRQEIVERANPKLGGTEVAKIVRATRGLTQPDIERIASGFSEDTSLPEPPTLSWCRNPVTGEYCERQLDPYDIRDRMIRQGFSASVCHAFRQFPLRLFNHVDFRPLNTFLFGLRPIFLVVGRKPG